MKPKKSTTFPRSFRELIRLPLAFTNGGFTLLEILVVVLIIGILGAIALPQYQKASLKSRFAALMPVGKAMADSNEAYYLEHGEYALDPQELPVQGRSNYAGGTAVNLVDGQDLSYVQVSNAQVPNAQYIVYQKHSNKLSGATVCEAADEQADELCLALGGTETSPATGTEWTAYLLSGTNSSVPGTCQVGTDTFQEGQAVGSNGLKCAAVCEDGDCETRLTGGQVYDTDYDSYTIVCTAASAYACAGSEFKGNMNWCNASKTGGCGGSIFSGPLVYCTGGTTNGCANSTFSGNSAGCQGNAANGCANSTFSGQSSRCVGNVANACTGSTLSGKGSFCAGNAANGCTGITLQAGTHCRATASGGCDGVTYEEGAWCQGSYCPSGSPKQGGGCWDGNGNQTNC